MVKNWRPLVVIGALALLGIGIMNSYNRLVAYEEKLLEELSNVEVQYQRRADLIPNLVNTVKGYAQHEREVLNEVVEARSRVGQMTLGPNATPEQIKKFMEAQGDLSAALSRLLLVVERYPDLKADKRFGQLQAQLEGTENRIAFARNKYNEAVRQYNSTVRRFPANLIANVFGFDQYPYFEADEGAEKAPEVKFN